MIVILLNLFGSLMYCRETTDSLSIAASPNGINFLKQAQNITQNITQSITNITSSHQDLGAKAPLLTPNDKSKEQFDKLSSTLTWSTIGKSSFFHTSGEQITHGCNVTQTVFNGKNLKFCSFNLFFLLVT